MHAIVTRGSRKGSGYEPSLISAHDVPFSGWLASESAVWSHCDTVRITSNLMLTANVFYRFTTMSFVVIGTNQIVAFLPTLRRTGWIAKNAFAKRVAMLQGRHNGTAQVNVW